MLTYLFVLLCATAFALPVTDLKVLQANVWKAPPASGALLTYNTSIFTNSSTLSKRQNPLGATLTQAGDRSLYWINVTIGTPGQPQSLQLDTGSHDFPIISGYTPSQSSTYEDADEQYTETFVDGSTVTGEFFFDSVEISGQTVTQQLMIDVSSGNVAESVMGVGWPASYQTINHNLAAQGIIASNSYSLWLDDLDAASGTILFGGLNTGRYVAPLLKLPSQSTSQPEVLLTRIAGPPGNVLSGSGYSESVILDSGTQLTILQTAQANPVMQQAGASYYPAGDTSGSAIIPCSQANADLSFNFHFGGALGPTINVDISELVLQDLGSLSGVEMCQFGIYGSDGSLPTILGDSFLRSAYVVYDLDTNHIGLAQTVFSGGGTNVVEIGAGGIPVGVGVS